MLSSQEILDRYVEGFDPQPFMLTAGGNRIVYRDPDPDQITLSDIAHHLGMLTRYTGALDRFYSIAEHCLLCTSIAVEVLNSEDAVRRYTVEYYDQLLAVLLHDAEEAYVNDLSSPLKTEVNGDYRLIATGLRETIYAKFGVDFAYHNDVVKQADLNALIYERYWMMPESSLWPKAPKGALCSQEPPMAFSWDKARDLYLATAKALLKGRERAFQEAA